MAENREELFAVKGDKSHSKSFHLVGMAASANYFAKARFDELGKTNVHLLLKTIGEPIDPLFKMMVIKELEQLSETKPDDFVQYEHLFPALHDILQDPAIDFRGPAVVTILDNISRIEENKPILKAKFEIFSRSLSSPHIVSLQACLKKAGILQIFDMRTITASEKPQVYGITGHGCVYEKRPPITVPKGVVWIEMAVCGKVMYFKDLSHFIQDAVKTFLEDTPIPTEKSLQNKYVVDLGNLVGYEISVKFPGQTIADGRNTVFAQWLDGYNKEMDVFQRSGIRRFYTDMDSSQSKVVPTKVVSYENGHYLLDDESYIKIYWDSVYPTPEQVLEIKPNQTNYAIWFKEMFEQIESQEYEVRSPMILIHVGCRVPCEDSLEGPTLRRANSIERKEELVRTLPIGELLKIDARGRTYLESLINDGLLPVARILVERIEAETSPETLIHYFSAGGGDVMEFMTRVVHYTDEGYGFKYFLSLKLKAARERSSLGLDVGQDERAFEDAVKYRYSDGRTELMNMLQDEFYPKAKLFMNRFESKKGTDALAAYLMIQDKRSRSVLTMMHARDFPTDLRELIISIISKIPVEMRAMIKPATAPSAPTAPPLSVSELFDNLNKAETKETISPIIVVLGRRALADVYDVLRYDGLFTALQRVLDKNVNLLDLLVSGLIGKIQTSVEDKNALATKYREYVATAGESIKLRKILTLKGAIAKAGSRKKKHFRKKRTTRRNKHFP